jgi:MoaE-MoaD fusion protein
MPEAATMRVDVRLFASYREAAGTNHLSTELPAGARVGDLLRALQARVPGLGASRGLVAVNRAYVESDDAPLQPGDEVALIPPVSGGA